MKMRQNRLAEGKENKPAAAEPAKKRTVPSGVLWFTVGNSMQAGTTVLMTMLTGYVLDLASVGIFSFALMASQLLYTVGLFGANDLQMTDYDHRYRFGDYFKVKVVSTLAAMLICFILPGLLGLHGRKMACLFLLTTYMLINSAAELYQSMLFQAQRLDLSGKMLFFRMAVSLAGFAVVILIKRSLLQACAVLLSVNFAATCFSVRHWCGVYRDSPCILRDGKEKELFIESFPLCLSRKTASQSDSVHRTLRRPDGFWNVASWSMASETSFFEGSHGIQRMDGCVYGLRGNYGPESAVLLSAGAP